MAISVQFTEYEMEACWAAASFVDGDGVVKKLGRVLDSAALTRLYNDAMCEVEGYGLPQFSVELTPEELSELIKGLERAVGRHELGVARPVPVDGPALPVQRLHSVHEKLYRLAHAG